MITRREFRFSLISLQFLSYMRCTPFKIATNGRVEDGNRWSRISYRFLLGISSLHFIFAILRLPTSLALSWSGWEVLSKVFNAYVILFEAGIPIHFWIFGKASAYNTTLFNDLVHNLPTGEEA